MTHTAHPRAHPATGSAIKRSTSLSTQGPVIKQSIGLSTQRPVIKQSTGLSNQSATDGPNLLTPASVNPPPQRRHSPVCQKYQPPPVLPAETGRPETSAEFTCRVKNGLVLHGPKDPSKRMEGRDQENSSLDKKDETVSKDTVPEVIPVTYPHETELLNQLCHQYTEDPLFRKVLESPNEYQNLEVKDGLVRIRLKDRTSLCIPKISVGERWLVETVIDQAHSILAHLGSDKTLSYLQEHI